MRAISKFATGFALLVSSISLGSARMGDFNDIGWMHGGILGIGIFGFIFMLLIIIALVLFIIWLIKQIQKGEK